MSTTNRAIIPLNSAEHKLLVVLQSGETDLRKIAERIGRPGANLSTQSRIGRLISLGHWAGPIPDLPSPKE